MQSFYKATAERRFHVGRSENNHPTLGSDIQGRFIGVSGLYVRDVDPFSAPGSSLTRSGSTATFAFPAGHNFVVGDTIQVVQVAQREYAGNHVVTARTSTPFSYEVSGTPATPATPATGYSTFSATKTSEMEFGWNSLQQTLIPQMVPDYKNGGVAWTIATWRAAAGINSSGFRRKKPREISSTSQTSDNDSNAAADGQQAYLLSNGLPHRYDSSATPKWQVTEATKSVTSITRVGQTATVTVVGHNYPQGSKVRIAGASQSQYNGDFVITVTSADTFTITVSGSPATPATGTITAALMFRGVDVLDSDLAAPNNCAYGPMLTGDYIGPWIFNELKAGLNLLVTASSPVNTITFEYT